MSVLPDGTVYIANPGDWGDLNMFGEMGLNIVKPEAEAGSYWQQLSLEQAMLYPSDILFVSSRPEAVNAKDIGQFPTYAAHPAVVAGQAFDWNQDFIMSYQGMKSANDDVTNALNTSKKVIG